MATGLPSISTLSMPNSGSAMASRRAGHDLHGGGTGAMQSRFRQRIAGMGQQAAPGVGSNAERRQGEVLRLNGMIKHINSLRCSATLGNPTPDK